ALELGVVRRAQHLFLTEVRHRVAEAGVRVGDSGAGLDGVELEHGAPPPGGDGRSGSPATVPWPGGATGWSAYRAAGTGNECAGGTGREEPRMIGQSGRVSNRHAGPAPGSARLGPRSGSRA